MRTTTAQRHWIVILTASLLTFLVFSGMLLYRNKTMPVASGASHLLPIGQWGYGSGTMLTKDYTHGVLTRAESYSFEKHGYYEVRHAIK